MTRPLASGAGLRVCVLYPEVLNGYADGGNLVVIERRCQWRQIPIRLAAAGIGDAVHERDHDLFVIGGGEDQDQARCAEDLLATKGDALRAAKRRGAVVFGAGGGFQLLGHGYDTGSGTLPGVGLLDVRTEAGEDRLVGDVVAEADLGDRPRRLLGHVNHRGRTRLGPGTVPLGAVVHGPGNAGDGGVEGARQGRVVGTYLHGPVLAKNVWLADWLVAAALGAPTLPPLDDRLEDLAHESGLRVALACGEGDGPPPSVDPPPVGRRRRSS